MKKIDRRIEKTRRAIFQALSDVLREKNYSNIFSKEIIDRADISRSAFYTHFNDKDMVLMQYIEMTLESLSNNISEQSNESKPLPVAEIFAYARKNSQLINNIIMSDGRELLFYQFKNYCGKLIKSSVLNHLPKVREPKIPIEVLINHVTTTLIELLLWWMQSGTEYTPEQMEMYYYDLIFPSITSAL